MRKGCPGGWRRRGAKLAAESSSRPGADLTILASQEAEWTGLKAIDIADRQAESGDKTT